MGRGSEGSSCGPPYYKVLLRKCKRTTIVLYRELRSSWEEEERKDLSNVCLLFGPPEIAKKKKRFWAERILNAKAEVVTILSSTISSAPLFCTKSFFKKVLQASQFFFRSLLGCCCSWRIWMYSKARLFILGLMKIPPPKREVDNLRKLYLVAVFENCPKRSYFTHFSALRAKLTWKRKNRSCFVYKINLTISSGSWRF